MSFGVPAALLLCIAGGFDLDGQASLELRGGRAPITAGAPPKWGFVGVATPDVQLSYLSPRLELRVDYGLRAFWRLPNDSRQMLDPLMVGPPTTSSRLEPLLLHQVGLIATGRATRRVRMNAEATASYGEADYTTIATLLGPTQAALPTIPKFLNIAAGGGTQVDLSRLSVFSLTLLFTHRRPIGATETVVDVNVPNVVPFPRQTSVAATPGLSVTVSRKGALTLGALFSYGAYSDVLLTQKDGTTMVGDATVLLFAPQVGWRAFLSPRSNLHVGAGANFLRLRPENPDLVPVSPVGDVTFESSIPKQQGLETRMLAALRMEYYFDPVTGRAGPRLVVSASGYSAMTTAWLAGIEAGYSTVFVRPFDPNDPRALQPPDETAVYASIPIRYRASTHLLTEFGFRWADRGPHSLSGFHQQQLWVYLLLTGTTRTSTIRKVQ